MFVEILKWLFVWLAACFFTVAITSYFPAVFASYSYCTILRYCNREQSANSEASEESSNWHQWQTPLRAHPLFNFLTVTLKKLLSTVD